MNYQIKISHYFNYFLVVVFMLSFSWSAWGQCTPQVADGFDYPLGDRGYCSDGTTPTPLLENIFSEQNALYPNSPVANPSRGGSNPGGNKWYNISDVGNFLNLTSTNGIHPGEDWNKGSGSNDAGEIVYAVANGKIVKVISAFPAYSTGGYTIIIEHTLPSNSKVYSVYTHITSLNNTNGTLATNVNQFFLSDNTTALLNSCVTRGTPIARLARDMQIPTHLHFEIRSTINLNDMYANDNGNGYYGAVAGASGRHTSMTQAQVTSAFSLMQTDGYLDPSDFIDNNRPLLRNINDNMSIYGGDATATAGKIAKFYFYSTGTVTASNIIAGGQGSRVRIGTAGSPQYATITNVQNAGGNANMKIVTVTMPVGSGLTNGQTYDIAFSLNSQVYTGIQLVYYQKAKDVLANAGITTTETGSNNSFPWMAFYARMALERGYMRAFNTTNDMTKGEASVIIVKAALEAGYAGILDGNDGQPFRIRTETTNGIYTDVPPCHPLFPYIQTLRNYGYSGAVSEFGVNNLTTIGDICSRIVSVFKIPATPTGNPTLFGSKVNISTNDPIARIQNISVIRQLTNPLNSRTVEKGFANAIDVTDLIFGNGTITIDATARVRRQVLSKILVNIYDAKALGDAGNKSTSDMNQFTIIGDKFELQDEVTGNSPNNSLSATITMQSGQVREFAYPLETFNGSRLHFYWTSSRGTLVSTNPKHRTVSYTAPIVTTNTNVDLYFYIGAENGRSGEAFIRIIVTPLPAGCNPASITATASNNSTANTCQNANITLSCTLPIGATVTWTGPNGYTSTTQNPTLTNVQTAQAGMYYATVKVGTCEKVVSTEVQVGFCTPPPVTPTVQASGLNFTNIGNNDGNINFQGGNGQNAIVLVSTSPITQNPVDGQSYSYSNNYPSAQSLGNAKVVYIGGANTVYLYGLPTTSTPQTYYVAVYEFNGVNTTTKYLTTNPASGQFTTITINPSVDFYWSPVPAITGQPVTFYNNSINYSTLNMSFTGGNVTNSNTLPVNVTYPTAGAYPVTLQITEATTNQTVNLTKTINVYNASQVQPDLVVQNASITPNLGYSASAYNVTVSFRLLNNGLNNANSSNAKYYLSNDNTYSLNDTYLAQRQTNNIIGIGSTEQFSQTFSIPFGTPVGNYFVLIYADADNNIIESNETNNVNALPITISAGMPDLIVQNVIVSPTTLNSGQLMSYNHTIRNVGNGNSAGFYIQYYFSADNILDANDIPWTTDLSSNILNPNTNYTSPNGLALSTTSTIPTGSYYLIVKTDDQNQVIEINENNNVYVHPTLINFVNPNQPILPTTNLNLNILSSTSIQVSWTNGNGSNRLLSARTDGYLVGFPQDGTVYSANTNFASAPSASFGKPVYAGNANSATITNLPTNTTISFSANEYNGTGTSTDYLQRNAPNAFAYLSNNSGATGWQPMYTGAEELYDIEFVTPTIGFIAGYFGIAKTTNDGVSWQVQYLPSFIQSIDFIDTNIGYAVGGNGSIYKTINAGISWVKQISGTSMQLNEVKFINANIGFAVGSSSTFNGVILKTIDGGSNWNITYTTNNSILTGLFVLDANNIWVSGSNNTTSGGIILKSTDLGFNWISYNTSDFGYNPALFIIYAVHFQDTNLGFAFCSNETIIKTIDGGQNWSLVYQGNTDAGTLAFPRRIRMLPSGIGYITSNGGRLLKTTNNGNNWILQNIGYTNNLRSLHLINENETYLVGNKIALKTTTGGDPRAINAPTLPTTVYCEGSTINIPYTMAGTFTAGNTFSVQLSNTEGKFTNPLVLGSLSSIANGTISCPLPAGIVGTGYKLRIVGSSPATIGAETNYTLTLNPRPQASFVGLLSSYCNSSSSVTLLPLVSGGTFSGTGVSGASFNPATAGVGVHTITYSLTQNGCTFSTSQSVEVTTATVSITSANATGCKGESVLLQVSNPRPNAVYQWRRNGVEITGATGSMFFASELGNALYSAVSNEGGCVATSNNLTLNIIEVPKPTITPNNNLLASSSSTGNQWYFNGVAIPSATTQFFTMNHTIAGFYSVEVTQNGCKSISDFFTVPNPPNIPNNLQLTLIPVLKGVLTWEASTNATGYQLERSSTSATSGFSILTEVASNILTYTDDVLPLPRVTYWYRVRAKGVPIFSNYSNIVELNAVTAIEEPLWAKNIKIYPNPVRDFIKVNLDGLQLSDISYSLFDTQGRQVLKSNVILDNNSMFAIGVTQLSKGVYNLQINTNKGKINRLIVVE